MNVDTVYTENWLLVGTNSAYQLGLILSAYLGCAYVLLPWLKRRMVSVPYLHHAMSIHNISLALINASIGFLLSSTMYKAGYEWRGQGLKNGELEDAIGKLVHCYFLSKIFELNDIAFAILRPRAKQAVVNSQVYHHTTMTVACWIAARHLRGGSSAILACINCILHVFMYVYYILSDVKLLPWASLNGSETTKNFLNACTFAQFATVNLHCITGLLSGCDYPHSAYIFIMALVTSYGIGFYWCDKLCNFSIGIPIQDTCSSPEVSRRRQEELDTITHPPVNMATGGKDK